MTLSQELVNYEVHDGIATITLDDGKLNVLSTAMCESLLASLDQAERDEAVVIVGARGRTFCAGLDLRTSDWRPMAARALEVSRRLLAFPEPTVVACNGNALAMGAFLLLSADVRIGAAGEHKIGLTEVAIGMTFPDAALALAAHRLTAPAFDRCLITGEVLTPEGAAAVGFLDAVVQPGSLAAEAGAAAQRLAALDRKAHLATKRSIRSDVLVRIDAQIRRLGEPGGGW